MSKISVLFVCAENICRSPMAHAMLKQRLRAEGIHHRVKVDSAGINVFRPGTKSDRRAVDAAAVLGVKVGKRSRRIKSRDFEVFDHVLVMDQRNLDDARRICPVSYHSKIRLMLEFAGVDDKRDVPDPYYSSEEEFDEVFLILDQAMKGIVAHLKEQVYKTEGTPSPLM